MLHIITDSNSGISQEEALTLNVEVIPMPIMIEDETYYEGVNLDSKTFYQALNSNKSVHTSKPLPKELLNIFDNILENEDDEILYIPMSSGLSSAYETANLLAKDYQGKITVVDNHRISVTLKSSVIDAVKLKNQGLTALQIKEILEKDAYDSFILIAVDEVTSLLKGGRSKGMDNFLNVLHIKPILKIEGEKLELYTKVRGSINSKRKVIEKIKEIAKAYDSDKIRYRIGYASSILDEAELKEIEGLIKEKFPYTEVFYDPLTLSIGTHVGSEAFGMGISKVSRK